MGAVAVSSFRLQSGGLLARASGAHPSQGDFNGYEAALITLRQTIAFLDPDERRLSYAGRESAGGRTIIAFYLVI